MKVELRHLRHIVVLARVQHYHQAARELGISQPALSKSVQAAEAEFGVSLFDRDRTGVRVTPSGRSIIAKAQEVLSKADEFGHFVDSVGKGNQGRLAFGMAPLPTRVLLRPALAAVVSEAPDIMCTVVKREAPALMDLLMADEIEFFVAVQSQLPSPAGIRIETIGRFPVSAIVRSEHPLLGERGADRNFPLLLATSSPISVIGVAPVVSVISNVTQVVEDYAALVDLTQRSDGVWLSSSFAVSEEMAAGTLRELPWPADSTQPVIHIGLYTIGRRPVSAAALRLKRAMQVRIAELTARFSAPSYRAVRIGKASG